MLFAEWDDVRMINPVVIRATRLEMLGGRSSINQEGKYQGAECCEPMPAVH